MQVAYEVKSSSIAGRGLFATVPIPRGTLIWKYSDKSVCTYNEVSFQDKLTGLSKAEAIELLEHVYTWQGKVVEILDDAKYWNHSRTAQNTGNHPDEGRGDGVSSYALRDIAAGEELLDDYAAYDLLPWFETLCQQHGASSCVSVGLQNCDT